MTERSYRTAPDRCFSGGYVGHGPIEPLAYPPLSQRIRAVFVEFRTHVGPVRKEWRTLAVSLMFGVMMVGFAVVTV